MITTRPCLRHLAVLCCAFLAALASVGMPSARAAVPCGEAVLLDWSDGTLDRVYSVACYRDALARLPEDLRAYSTAPEDIERALLERARADTPAQPPAEPPAAAEAEETQRALAGPTRTPTTTQEEAVPAAPDSQPPASPDTTGDAVAAPVTAEPAASTKAPAVVIAALLLLAAGAAIPLVRALAGRRRGV